MNQYNRRLQSIQESDQEYYDHQSAQNRLSISNQGSYNFENSSISKILMGKNLNSIQLPSSLYLKNQQQDNQALQKYSSKPKLQQSQAVITSQQQISPNLQTQSQKYTLPNTIEDLLTVQNGGTSKHFFDENSIDLSFINFLNKDDQQNAQQVSSNMSKALYTNRQYPQYASVFQSNGQLSSIQNLNTSNNLTQYPSAILGLGGVKASQQVQEKYQQGLQNINDLVQLLTSPSYTPDRVAQTKQQDNNMVSQNNQDSLPKPISQQYDEIMRKYQSVLQNSQNDKVNEMDQDNQRSPLNNQNESIKINDISECLYPISDSYSHSNIAPFNNPQQDPNTLGQKAVHQRLSSLEYQKGSNENNQNKIIDRKRLSPSSRQFTFEQNNDMRSSSLSLNKLNNQSINTNQFNDNQLFLNNQKSNAYSINNKIANSEITQNSNNYIEEATKKASNQNQQLQSPLNSVNLNDVQKYNINSYQNQITQSGTAITNSNVPYMGQNQLLDNKVDYSNSLFVQSNVTPSLKSQQYEQILQKYLPKGYTTQNSTNQNIKSSQNSQSNSASNSMIANGGISVQTNYQNNDTKNIRDRSNSINKLATARELLENFSATNNYNSYQSSSQPRQPLGIIQNNITNSLVSEKFNTLNSAQKMKDSNMFLQNNTLKESNVFQQNQMKDSNGFQYLQFKDSKGFQNQSINQNTLHSKNLTFTQQQMTQQNTLQDEASGIPQCKPLFNTTLTNKINPLLNSNYNNIISNLPDVKVQTYFQNTQISVNENISQLQNKRASFDHKQPIQQLQQAQNSQTAQITSSDYNNQIKYNQQYPASQIVASEANKNNQIELNDLQAQISYNQNIDNVSALPTSLLNTQDQFFRTNNHMKSINQILPQQISLPLNSNQVTRRQSAQSESRLLSQQYDLSSQRKNSVDKPFILDAKSLLMQKEQEIKIQTTEQQNSFNNLQQQIQQPLQLQTIQPFQQQHLLQPLQQQQQQQQQQYLKQPQSQSFYQQQQQQFQQNQTNNQIQQTNLQSTLPQPQFQQYLQLQQQNLQLTNQNQFQSLPQNLQQQQPQVFQQQQMLQLQGISIQQTNPQALYQQQTVQSQGSIQQQGLPQSLYQQNKYLNYQTLNFQNQHQPLKQQFEARQGHVEQGFNTQSNQKLTQQQRSNSISSATQSNKFQSQPFDKLTINTQLNKEIVIPSTISPISTPTNGRNKQNNVDKEFELEFKDFVLDLQTQQQTQQGQEEKRTLNPSHSQPFLTNTFFSAQKEQVSNNLNNNDYMVKSQQKPKRKIFEEHFKNQSSNKTLKMNGQMLKNVLGFTKGQTRNSNNLSDNQYSLRANTENNLSGNAQEMQQAKDLSQNNNPNLNFSRQTMQNILNPYRQLSQTNYLPPKPKYMIPPKEVSPIKNYYANASIHNQNQESEKLRTSQNQDSKEQQSDQKMQEFNIFSNKQSIATSALRFTNKNEGTSYIPSEAPSQYDKSYQTGTLQPSFKQTEEAKDMIRTIKSDEQLEENVKRTQFSRSKSTAKIFANQNEDNKNSSQGVQITFQNPLTAQNSYNAADIIKNPEFKKSSVGSIYKPQQTQNNFVYPQITDKDRKMLQMVEQKIQNQLQDQSVLGIPILCINCDNYYEQKEIENHSCIPKESNQLKQEVKQELENQFSYQKNSPEHLFSVENSLVNDKIKVIYEKISEQPQSDEQDQIKQLIERILKLNLNSEGLAKECRTLSHLNKTVENIKSRAGLSLLILSQRAEVLLKDKIDIYRRKEGLNQNQNASNVFNINHINQMNVLEFNKSSYNSSRANAFASNQNIENQKVNRNEELPTEYDVTEINFTQNNKTDRIESNRNTANTNYEKVNSINILPTSNSPRSNLNINQNQVSIQKNRIFSPPVTKIFYRSLNGNFEPNNKIQNYNQKIEIESTTNYSKKKQGISYNQNDDAQSQYSSSQMSIESKDLLKKQQQSSSLIKFNESSMQSQQKRQFYNIALNLKLKLPANHPARDCVISEMFTQAEKQNIPENNYQKYIENYFKQFKN